MELVIDLLQPLNLLVTQAHLCENLIQVDILEYLQVFHLVLEFSDLLLFIAFVALQSDFLIIELL